MAVESQQSKVIIPPAMQARFRTAFALSPEKLKEINAWTRANESFLLDNTGTNDGPEKTGVASEDFFSAISVVGTFIFSAERDNPATIEGFIEALKGRGLGEFSEKAKILLQDVNIPYKRVEYARQKALALRSVVPTLEGVSCVCDLRAVFRRYPSVTNKDDERGDVKVLLGFEPIAQLTVDTNDANNDDHSCVFQATETELKDTIKVLEDALAQLNVLKEKASI